MVKNLVFLLILLLSIIFIYVVKDIITIKREEQVGNAITDEPARNFEPQIDDQAEVNIKVVPKVLLPGKEAVFQITLDTHSVVLDYDFLQISELTDDRGKTYQATSWSGGSGGHHLQGELVFPSLSNTAKSTELIISQVGGVERKFKWNL